MLPSLFIHGLIVSAPVVLGAILSFICLNHLPATVSFIAVLAILFVCLSYSIYLIFFAPKKDKSLDTLSELEKFPAAYVVAHDVFNTGNTSTDARKLQVLLSRKYGREPSIHFCETVIIEIRAGGQ